MCTRHLVCASSRGVLYASEDPGYSATRAKRSCFVVPIKMEDYVVGAALTRTC